MAGPVLMCTSRRVVSRFILTMKSQVCRTDTKLFFLPVLPPQPISSWPFRDSVGVLIAAGIDFPAVCMTSEVWTFSVQIEGGLKGSNWPGLLKLKKSSIPLPLPLGVQRRSSWKNILKKLKDNKVKSFGSPVHFEMHNGSSGAIAPTPEQQKTKHSEPTYGTVLWLWVHRGTGSIYLIFMPV